MGEFIKGGWCFFFHRRHHWQMWAHGETAHIGCSKCLREWDMNRMDWVIR